MDRDELDYKKMAQLVAYKLTRDELIELAILLDGDAGNDFCHFIQHECEKVAPELYRADPKDTLLVYKGNSNDNS